MLRLSSISKSYGARRALEDVSVEVQRGQILGLYGGSGSGKSTLLRIAAGLLAPDAGQVFYDGQRLDRLAGSERMRLRRREIACVWTEPSESRLSVADHVALPLLVDRRDRRTAQHRALEALAACEASECAGMELSELSGGERQRVAIARALVIEPRLLLADSPACRLSLTEQETIMALLASLAQEARVAVLVADSDAESLIGAQTILCLREGRLIDAEPADGGRVYAFPERARRAAVDA